MEKNDVSAEDVDLVRAIDRLDRMLIVRVDDFEPNELEAIWVAREFAERYLEMRDGVRKAQAQMDAEIGWHEAVVGGETR